MALPTGVSSFATMRLSICWTTSFLLLTRISSRTFLLLSPCCIKRTSIEPRDNASFISSAGFLSHSVEYFRFSLRELVFSDRMWRPDNGRLSPKYFARCCVSTFPALHPESPTGPHRPRNRDPFHLL